MRRGERLYLTGEGTQLGKWHSELAIAMYEQQSNEWAVTLDATNWGRDGITFKFIIKKDNGDPAII